jgi:gliding motility-associated-like protein
MQVKNLKILTAAIALLFSINGYSQLNVTPNGNANALLSAIIGQGVTVSNVTINCPNGAAGTFTGGNGTNLGLSSGMMLTTGSATGTSGPNDNDAETTNHGTSFNDADLLALEPLARFDPCILEFDIIPTCGTLSINYVFGSDEYMVFVNAGFNDAFGFFITGPNPGGGNYNALNIARIAGPNIPVTIDNINLFTNSTYYVDNDDGTCIGFPPFIPYPVTCTNPYYMQYNGFTIPLTASVAVVPCSTYRMKLAIADAGDGDYDSGVFFAGSGVNGGGLFCQGATNLALTYTTNLTCSAPNSGTATVNPTGGNPPYTYLWSNGQTTQTATGLSAGTYDVTVTDNACSSANTNYTIVLTTTGPAIIISKVDIPCNGATTGSATVNITGGAAPNTIAWSNGVTTANNPNLVAGTYGVTVTDNIGCLAIGSVTIAQASTLAATASATASACGAAGTGTVSVTPSGGTPPYTYAWSNGPTAISQSNLGAGTYTVTVTDNAGCILVASATVTTPTSFTLGTATTNGNCTALNTASINLTVTGGLAPISYSWSNAAVTEDISNLTAGTYTVTVTDANGCIGNIAATVAVPVAVTATIANTPVGCFGGNNGTATVNTTSGTAPITYAWSNAGNTATINGLSAGTYTVTVTGTGGCSATLSTTIIAPAALSVTLAANNPICPALNNGSITATPAGGTGPFTYLWSNSTTTSSINSLLAGAYSVTVTDANSCTATASVTLVNPPPVNVTVATTDELCNTPNSGTATATISNGTAPYSQVWSNSGNTVNINNLAAGSYSVSVTDGVGCTATASGNVNASTLPTVSIAPTNLACNGDNSGAVEAVGSFASFTWGHGATTNPSTGLAAGNYDVTVADANGCTASATMVLTEPSALGLTLTPTALDCNITNSGSASSVATGGTAPLTFLWSNSAVTPPINNLAPGTYALTVTDANGCTITDAVTLATPNPPTLSLNITQVTCAGPNTAAIDAVVTGGTQPITYSWSTSATSASIGSLGAGNYAVTITDGAGCTATAAAIITGIPVLPITATLVNPSCFGDATGSIDVTGPYTTFTWSDGDLNMPKQNLVAGSYSVTVSDNGGCSATQTYVITEPALLQLSITATQIDCTDPFSGALQANVSGGVPSYIYQWSNAATVATLNTLDAGTYSVTVTDNNGCSLTATEILPPNPASTVSLGGNRAICAGETVLFNLDSITAPMVWQNGTTANQYTATTAETVKVVVDFPNGCQGVDSVKVSVGTQVVLYDVNDTTLCEGEWVRYTIGPEGFVYEWSNGEFGPEILIADSGIYTVTATSDCNIAEDTVTVKVERCNCEVFMPNAFSPNGDGVNDLFKGFADCERVTGYKLDVFDRWGALAYTTSDFSEGWNGTMSSGLCISGVYVWKVVFVETINGIKYQQSKTGSVVLLK